MSIEWQEEVTIVYYYTSPDKLCSACVDCGPDGWRWVAWYYANPGSVITKTRSEGLADTPRVAMQEAAAWLKANAVVVDGGERQ